MGKQVETGQHAPHTAVEVQLAAIWSTALGMEEIDVNDSFLDLGGYSLQAIRIISRVLQTFGVALALETLFGAGTIADMARLVEEQSGMNLATADLKQLLDELDALQEPPNEFDV